MSIIESVRVKVVSHIPESSSSVPHSEGISVNDFLSNLSVNVQNTKILSLISLWWNKGKKG